MRLRVDLRQPAGEVDALEVQGAVRTDLLGLRGPMAIGSPLEELASTRVECTTTISRTLGMVV